MDFILSDESVNRYKFRVVTAGIDIEAFQKNPVMLYAHQRSTEYSGIEMLPIGKWENIRKENGKLIASPVFDEKDEFAQKIKSKVEQGILNAASVCLDPIELSEDPKLMLAGQLRPTIVKSELWEASIVDIPGNGNALKLHFASKGITLSGDMPDEVLNAVLPSVKPILKMNKIAAKLGLPADASEDQILAALETKLSLQAGMQDKLIAALLTAGKQKGLINEKNEAHFKTLAAANYDAALAMVEAHEAPAADTSTEAPKEHVSLSAAIEKVKTDTAGAAGADENDRTKWNLTMWRQKDPKGLEQLRASKPAEFEKLLKTLNTTV